MMRRFVGALALCWLFASSSAAQSTGGSFGGSDWGSSGSSSGGGSSSGSSWGSGSYAGAGSGGTTSATISTPVLVLIGVAFGGLFVGLAVIAIVLLRSRKSDDVDVSVTQVVLDARARRFIQKALAEKAKDEDGKTQLGRALTLTSTDRILRESKLAWLYGGGEHLERLKKDAARAQFDRLVNDARAAFQYELVRGVDGRAVTEAAPEMKAREHEGEGVVLVTVVVASRRDLPKAPPTTVENLLVRLQAPDWNQLVAFEVVWTPATENDRMSTDELEARYPKLTRLPGAIGGRVFCSYCGGPYAAELAKCPHCGAASASARA